MENDFLELKRHALNFHTNAINLPFGCQTWKIKEPKFIYQLKVLLDAKLLAKLFSKVTKNNLIYPIVYRVFYRKLNQRLLKEGKE